MATDEAWCTNEKFPAVRAIILATVIVIGITFASLVSPGQKIVMFAKYGNFLYENQTQGITYRDGLSAKSTHAIECDKSKRLISQSGKDGMGHQLLGVYSCMLLQYLQPENFCYVKKIMTTVEHTASVEKFELLIDQLERDFPNAPRNASVQRQDNCWELVKSMCTEENKEACNLAKQRLSFRLSHNLQIEGSYSNMSDSILLHVRGGDRPGFLMNFLRDDFPWPLAIDRISRAVNVSNFKILCETEHDKELLTPLMKRISKQAPHLRTEFMVGGDAIDVWLLMQTAKALIVGESSFSVSASLVRHDYTFSRRRNPIDGRYDVNAMPCELKLHDDGLVRDYTIYYGALHGQPEKYACPLQ